MSTEVWVSKGATINVGNYESSRVEFGVKVSTKRGETISEAVARTEEFVDAIVRDRIAVIKGVDVSTRKTKIDTATNKFFGYVSDADADEECDEIEF